MHRTCGVELSQEQAYLMDERLEPLARTFEYPSVEAFVQDACRQPVNAPLPAALLDGMTVHESFFFRDVQFWHTLEGQVLPALRDAGVRGLRVWCAAAAHGQEAYSVAMLLQEHWPELAADATILATDVSAAAVHRGMQGLFSALEVNRGISAIRLLRHFEHAPGGFRVRHALRQRITWRTHNLLDAQPPDTGFHLILCRNVFIYFNQQDRHRALRLLASAGTDATFLGIGSSEQVALPRVGPGWYRFT